MKNIPCPICGKQLVLMGVYGFGRPSKKFACREHGVFWNPKEYGDMPHSNCCGAVMYNWPDNDICPKCHEHCDIHEEGQDIDPLELDKEISYWHGKRG